MKTPSKKIGSPKKKSNLSTLCKFQRSHCDTDNTQKGTSCTSK